MKGLLKIILAIAPAVAALDMSAAEKDHSAAKDHLQNHYKLYGFVRNYFAFDTRESKSGTGDLFYYLPKDRNLNELGEDLNAQNSFRFLALTSRLGVDVSGYHIGKTHFGAKIEGDFYAGLSGSTGTATARLRQAYATISWKELPMRNDSKADVALKVGQAWHPIAADQPDVFDLSAGAPFNPFSRTPQVTMDASLGNHWILTASLLWQMQYTSAGPSGDVSSYIKYSCTPEIYAGITYKAKGFLVRAGADILSIKPRWQGEVLVSSPEDNAPDMNVTRKVSDRLTTISPYMYLQYKKDKFTAKAKTTYGSAGEHIGLMSGYGVTAKYDALNEDGHWDYAPLHSSSSWLSLSYGKKWQGTLFLGYLKNLGSSADLLNEDGVTDAADFWFNKNGFKNLNQIMRVSPQVLFNYGKLALGLEYEFTAVQYGDGKSYNKRGLSLEDLHWISNHRVQMVVKFSF